MKRAHVHMCVRGRLKEESRTYGVAIVDSILGDIYILAFPTGCIVIVSVIDLLGGWVRGSDPFVVEPVSLLWGGDLRQFPEVALLFRGGFERLCCAVEDIFRGTCPSGTFWVVDILAVGCVVVNKGHLLPGSQRLLSSRFLPQMHRISVKNGGYSPRASCSVPPPGHRRAR